ncbi:hypothetical protein ACWEQ3_01395 [Streptomyces mirabilis]
MTKACGKCGQVQSLSAFPKDSRRKDGRRARCKACVSVDNKAQYEQQADQRKTYQRERYAANPERERERKRIEYRTRVERIARIRASQRRYYWRNRDARIAQSLAWRLAHPEQVKAYNQADAQRRKEYHRAWRTANPDKVRAYRAAYDSQAARTDFLTQWRAAQH